MLLLNHTIDEKVGAIVKSLGVLADDVVQAEIQLVVSKHLFSLHCACRIIISLLTYTHSHTLAYTDSTQQADHQLLPSVL